MLLYLNHSRDFSIFDLRFAVALFVGDCPQRAKQTVRFVFDAGGEEQEVRRPAVKAVAEFQRPKPVNRDWLPLRVRQLAIKLARSEIKGVDASVPKVADQEVVAELAEIVWGERQAPR